jgi:hypothetical protein
MNSNDLCKGCNTYMFKCLAHTPCKITEKETLYCPCINCLIKGICIKACRMFKEFSKIYDFKDDLHQQIMKGIL